MLGAVRTHPGAYIDGVTLQHIRDIGIGQVAENHIQQIHTGHAACHLAGMDVALGIEGGLILRRSGGAVGDGDHPDFPALGSFPNGLQRSERRIFFGIAL